MQRAAGGSDRPSTAQMQVVGKRHFGKKAARPAAAADAQARASSSTRCCCGRDACRSTRRGEARIEVPLNDSLTRFRIVAVAHGGAGLFGTGGATIRTTQDLMLLSGAAAGRARAGRVPRRCSPCATPPTAKLALERRRCASSPADGKAVVAPPRLSGADARARARRARERRLAGQGAGRRRPARLGRRRAHARGRRVRPHRASTQKVVAVHPVRVYQATLAQLDKPLDLPVAIRPTRCPGAAACAVALARAARRRARRRARVHEPLSLHLPRAARVEGGRRCGDEALWRAVDEQPARLSRPRRARALLPRRLRSKAATR